ncbi:hypothetical protein ACFE04_028296 [Oxalis oulophora]
MKNKASGILKQVISMVTNLVKAKTMGLKRKTNALRARIIIFSLLHKKILVSSITQKLHAFTESNPTTRLNNNEEEESDYYNYEEDQLDQSKAVVLHECNAMSHEHVPNYTQLEYYEDEDDKYPDLTHSLFDEEEIGGSVIEMVKNSKEDEGKEFVLEDEIDHVADLFIKKFHRQIKIQKQNSFKRYQEMLNRGIY